MKKRVTSLVLALLMVLTLLPVQAWAADVAEEPVDAAAVQEEQEDTAPEEPAQQEEPEQDGEKPEAANEPEQPEEDAEEPDGRQTEELTAAAAANAAVYRSGSCGKNGDNVKWVLTSDGTLTISGEGEMEDYVGRSGPWSGWRDGEERVYVETVIVEEGVTSIGDNAFGNTNPEMTSVTLPSSVKTIGINAFGTSQSLSSVTLSEGLKEIKERAFENCDALTEITLPVGLEVIGPQAFQHSGLTGITVPEGVTEIGEEAFSGCTNLANITLSNSLITIGDGAFWNIWALEKIEIPDSVVRIGKQAFQNCIRLAKLTLGASVEEIGESAFQSCELKELKLPESLKVLGDRAFRDMYSWEMGGIYLEQVTIPASVVSIGKSVFTTSEFIVAEGNNHYMAQDGVLFSKDGKTLVSYPSKRDAKDGAYIIPNGVERIASCAFDGDCTLRILTIPASVTTIESGALITMWLRTINVDSNNKSFISVDNVLYSADKKSVIRCTKRQKDYTILDGVERIEDYCFYFSDITGITIPNTVTYIGEEAFTDCYMKTVDIPDGVEMIGDYAFLFCYNLSSVKLPSQLKVIGKYAFQESGLTEVTIPEGVKEIGDKAFYECRSLEKAVIPGSVTSMGEDIFWHCEKLAAVEFKNGVRAIGEGMFAVCYALKTVTIPRTVSVIGLSAFMSCRAITDVYYGGTREEWDLIQLNYNDELTADTVTLHCAAPTPLRLGDIDGDGKTTAIETQALYALLGGFGTLTDRQKKALDFTGDGILDVYDLQYCYEVAVGLLPQPDAQ